ncbi:hypothetical protein N3K66_001937 [Trichothecium roseum]|uniref:Uncharacterized protein n=1 Tax=Trichothecium roseum TaxID=47278 RepID=A0ACC0VA41_9HYPO|nr:hypothetical protein N3K66_001937 [Trichothecium roseum]
MVQRSRNVTTLPGGREVPRSRELPENIALGQLPIAHQAPGQLAQLYHQPAVFSINAFGQHLAQPYHMTGPYPGQGVPASSHSPTVAPTESQLIYSHMTGDALAYVQPLQLPHSPTSPVSYASGPTATHQANLNSQRPQGGTEPGNRGPDRQPGVLQRFARLLRMPTGRASTIASSDDGHTPRRSRSTTRSVAGAAERTDQEPQQTTRSTESDQRPRTPEMRPQTPQRPDDAETDSSSSASTNVATVHSDDYDIIRVPSELSEQPYRQRVYERDNIREQGLERINEISSVGSSEQGIGVPVSAVSMSEPNSVDKPSQLGKKNHRQAGVGSKAMSPRRASRIPRYVQPRGPVMSSGLGPSSSP